jgi:hypothetical protein
MHFLTRQRLHLSRFHPLMKALLTLYIASVAAAVWVGTLKYSDRAVFSPAGAARYVSGADSRGGTPQRDAFGDPFAGTPEGVARDEGLSRRELVDIVHPHLFTVPIVLFILGHLLHLTRLPDRGKLAINVAAFLAFFVTFVSPLLVSDRAAIGWLLFGGGCTFLLSLALLCLVPLWEMWLGKPGEGFDAMPRRESSEATTRLDPP